MMSWLLRADAKEEEEYGINNIKRMRNLCLGFL
jgi:hypothetical protein